MYLQKNAGLVPRLYQFGLFEFVLHRASDTDSVYPDARQLRRVNQKARTLKSAVGLYSCMMYL
jgi:hypothetical protein